MKKMFNITTHQGNTNQNHDEITSEDISIVPIRKKKKSGKIVENLEPMHCLWKGK